MENLLNEFTRAILYWFGMHWEVCLFVLTFGSLFGLWLKIKKNWKNLTKNERNFK